MVIFSVAGRLLLYLKDTCSMKLYLVVFSWDLFLLSVSYNWLINCPDIIIYQDYHSQGNILFQNDQANSWTMHREDQMAYRNGLRMLDFLWGAAPFSPSSLLWQNWQIWYENFKWKGYEIKNCWKSHTIVVFRPLVYSRVPLEVTIKHSSSLQPFRKWGRWHSQHSKKEKNFWKSCLTH